MKKPPLLHQKINRSWDNPLPGPFSRMRVTITVTATRADDTAEVAFTVEVEPEPEPVLPLLGQLLLALGLLAGGGRLARRRA